MSIEEELGKMIQKAAIDGVLNERAVEHYNSLIGEVKSLQAQTETDKLSITKKDVELRQVKARLSKAEELVKMAMDREAAVVERENKMTKLETMLEGERLRIEDHKEMFTTVFRNSVLRREVMTPIRGSEGTDQYNNQLPGGFASKDTVEEEEK